MANIENRKCINYFAKAFSFSDGQSGAWLPQLSSLVMSINIHMKNAKHFWMYIIACSMHTPHTPRSVYSIRLANKTTKLLVAYFSLNSLFWQTFFFAIVSISFTKHSRLHDTCVWLRTYGKQKPGRNASISWVSNRFSVCTPANSYNVLCCMVFGIGNFVFVVAVSQHQFTWTILCYCVSIQPKYS